MVGVGGVVTGKVFLLRGFFFPIGSLSGFGMYYLLLISSFFFFFLIFHRTRTPPVLIHPSSSNHHRHRSSSISIMFQPHWLAGPSVPFDPSSLAFYAFGLLLLFVCLSVCLSAFCYCTVGPAPFFCICLSLSCYQTTLTLINLFIFFTFYILALINIPLPIFCLSSTHCVCFFIIVQHTSLGNNYNPIQMSFFFFCKSS